MSCASVHTDAERTNAVEEVDKMLEKLANELPTLLTDVFTCGNLLKEIKPCTFNSASAGSSEFESFVAAELQSATEAANSEQILTCTKKINDASNRLATLTEETKQTRQKLDNLTFHGFTSEDRRTCQLACIYLDQGVALMYAIEQDLNVIRLAAYALYVHGQRAGVAQLPDMEGLKDATARLVALSSSAYFKYTTLCFTMPR